MSSVSFALAFFSGVLTVISPCAITLIPAFLTIAVRSKKRLLLSTLFFILGFSIIFVLFGFTASVFGHFLSQNRVILAKISGIVLMWLGIAAFLGKGFGGLKIVKSRLEPGFWSMFIFGVAFAIGWTPCVGPILGAILTIAANQSTFEAIMLLLAYSSGISSVLLFFAIFSEKINFSNPLLSGRIFNFNILNYKITTHSTNMIAGIIIFLFGLMFFIFGGALFTSTNIFGLVDIFIFLQTILESNLFLVNSLGYILIFIFILFFGFKVYKSTK